MNFKVVRNATVQNIHIVFAMICASLTIMYKFGNLNIAIIKIIPLT
ncbi:TPA: hypothetical protein ACKOIX_003702 [Clostridioides difficile]